MGDEEIDRWRAESAGWLRDGYLLIAVSLMFLVAVGWWGHAGRWWEAWTAAGASWLLAWCAGGELRQGRIAGERADQLAERLRAGEDCCCGLSVIPRGAHFCADDCRIHTPTRCQDLHAWAAAGGVL